MSISIGEKSLCCRLGGVRYTLARATLRYDVSTLNKYNTVVFTPIEVWNVWV